MLRSIKSPQRLPRQLAFKIDGTGTASILIGSKDATLTDNGTGDYTVTFAEPFARLPVVVGSPITAGSMVEIAVASATAVQVLCKKRSDGTAVDTDFHLIVQGFDASDEY
jgi:hypothetical protein